MRTRLIAPALLALLPATALAQVTPGRWAYTSTVVSADMPGVPQQILAMMKKPRTINYCLSPEEAKRGPQEMMKRDKSCTFTRYLMAGGKLDSVMVCKHGGSTMTATSKGSYTPTGFDTDGTVTMTGAQAMTITVHATGKLTGPCTK